jgi:hypothetical protein
VTPRFALASERVSTDVIMVPLFPYLAVRYGIGDVPSTVVDGRLAVVGPRDEDAYLRAIRATMET